MTYTVRAKKNLGQHFLNDKHIAQLIVESLIANNKCVIEVGPGMGILTDFLIESDNYAFTAIDIDGESIDYLKKKYAEKSDRIVYGDFLRMQIEPISKGEKVSIIGNFPYNISSQILFKVLDNKTIITEVVGMLQKEVAERIAANPGSKTYGITSVLLQAYYSIEYLFTVDENVFTPPPNVKSAVVRLTRNSTEKLDCDEKLLIQIVKASFNQRRKMMRNSLKPFFQGCEFEHHFMDKRPETLSIGQFVELTNAISTLQNEIATNKIELKNEEI